MTSYIFMTSNLERLVRIFEERFFQKEETLTNKKICNYDHFHAYFLRIMSFDFKCTQHKVKDVDYLKNIFSAF